MADAEKNNLSLPAELLLKIFKNAAENDDVDASAKELFRLSRVCSLWRAILFDYGSTWSTLSLATADVTQRMLARSKSAPLTLRVDLGIGTRWVGSDSAVARKCGVATQYSTQAHKCYITGSYHR